MFGSRKEYYQERLEEHKQQAHTLYNKIIQLEQSNAPYYEIKDCIYDLSSAIEEIIYFTERLNRREPSLDLYDFERRPTPEEIAAYQKEELNIRKETVEAKQKFIERILADIKDERRLSEISSKLELNLFRTQLEAIKITKAFRIYEGKPDLTDGEIDIYINDAENGIGFEGLIYLHNTTTEVGNIAYRGPVDNEWLGDIGYNVMPEHQGHNYALKALNLIQDTILSKGIDKVVITTYEDNIPSIRTIEKFGGIPLPSKDEEVLRYECHLVPKVELEETAIKK